MSGRLILFILGILSLIAGLLLFVAAKGALHEIEAFVLGLIGWVQIIGATIIDRLDRIRETLAERPPP